MISYVYVIIDRSFDEFGRERGKMYVGKANNPNRRFNAHVRAAFNGKNDVFHRAIRTHGSEHFSLKEVITCQSEDAAFSKETELIASLRTYIGFDDCNGYNSTLGGEGLDSETASKLMKSVWKRDHIERSLSNKKRWEDLEQRHLQSLKLKEVRSDPEFRAKLTDVMLVRWKSEQYCQRMSENHVKRWQDPVFREKVILAIKEAKSKPEEKQRLAKRNSKKWASLSDDEKKIIIDRMNHARKEKSLLKKSLVLVSKDKKKSGPTTDVAKQSWLDPDIRQKRCESMKKAWIKRRERLIATKQEKGLLL